jgi:hypothetical protein
MLAGGGRIPGVSGMTNKNRVWARSLCFCTLNPDPRTPIHKHLEEKMEIQKRWNLPVLVAVVGLMLLCCQGAHAWPVPDTGQTKCYN